MGASALCPLLRRYSTHLITNQIMKKRLLLGCVALLPFSAGAQLTTIVNDSWPTGSLAPEQPLEASWHSTSTSSAIEVGTGFMGLVTGSSGRAIHGAFDVASINVGETLVAEFTFNTPATIGDRTNAFRIALLNSSGTDMAQNFTYSSTNLNPLLDPPVGYMLSVDVSAGGGNMNIRESLTARSTGVLTGSLTGWAGLGSGGDNFTFAPSSTYTGIFSIERTGVDAVTLSASILQGSTLISSHSVSGGAGIVNSFDAIAFSALANTFGSSNVVGAPDNGVDFTNVTISIIPEPSTYALLFGAFGLAWVLIRRRRR